LAERESASSTSAVIYARPCLSQKPHDSRDLVSRSV
jgi:hypothetical protein